MNKIKAKTNFDNHEFLRSPTKKELREFIKLADDEIKEWKEFKKLCQLKLKK